MGLSPALILGGILVMAVIAMTGVIQTPEKTTEILGFCGTITGILLLMLKQDQDTKRMNQKIETSDQRAVEAAKVVKEAVKEAEEKKIGLLTKIDAQTNGGIDAKLNKQTETIIAAIPEAVAPVITPK